MIREWFTNRYIIYQIVIQGEKGQTSDGQDGRDLQVVLVFFWIHKCMKTPSVNFLMG